MFTHKLKLDQLPTQAIEVLSIQGCNFQVMNGRRRGNEDIAHVQIVTGEFGCGKEFAALIGDTFLNGDRT